MYIFENNKVEFILQIFSNSKKLSMCCKLITFYVEHSKNEWNRIISNYEYGTKSKIPICQLYPECRVFSSLVKLWLHPKSAMGTNQDGINPSELERHNCETLWLLVSMERVSSGFLSFLRPRLKVTDQIITFETDLWPILRVILLGHRIIEF